MILCYAIETIMAAGPDRLLQQRHMDTVSAETGLLDRGEELLVYATLAERDSALRRLECLGVRCEPLELLRLPEADVLPEALYEDVVIETDGGRVYTVWPDVLFFRLTDEGPEAEAAPALLQLRENMAATVAARERIWHVVERKEDEWVERVARAYGCGVEWYDPASG